MPENIDHPNINKNVHPPLVALLYIVLACLLGWLVPLTFMRTGSDLLRGIGLGLVILGFVSAASAAREFRRARTTLDPHGSVKMLVTSGAYRYSRNPIYLGFVLALIGLPLALGSFWGIPLAPLFILSMDRLVIKREEAYLEKKFGEVYTGYRSRVRRWL